MVALWIPMFMGLGRRRKQNAADELVAQTQKMHLLVLVWQNLVLRAASLVCLLALVRVPQCK